MPTEMKIKKKSEASRYPSTPTSREGAKTFRNLLRKMGYSRDDIDRIELDFEISVKANGEHIQVIYGVEQGKIVFNKFLSREGNPLFKDKDKEHHFYACWEKMQSAVDPYVETVYKLYPEPEGSHITVHIEFCHLEGHMPHTKEGDGYIFRVSSSNGTWFDMREIQEEVAPALNLFSEKKLNEQHIYTLAKFISKGEAAVSLSVKDLEQPEGKLNNLLENFRYCPIIQSLFGKKVRAEGFVATLVLNTEMRQKYNNVTQSNPKLGLDFMHPFFKYKFEEQREVNEDIVKVVLNNKDLTPDEKVQELVKHVLYSQVRKDKNHSLMY